MTDRQRADPAPGTQEDEPLTGRRRGLAEGRPEGGGA